MNTKTMREKLEEAKKIYFMDNFRAFMRKLQGVTDEDFKEPVPRIKEKTMKSEETDPLEMQNKQDLKFYQKQKESRNG